MDYLFNTAKLETIIRSFCTNKLKHQTTGNMKLEDLIRSSSMNNLYYITSGTIPPDPAEVLGSKAMENFLEKMKNLFDIVIIDSDDHNPIEFYDQHFGDWVKATI